MTDKLKYSLDNNNLNHELYGISNSAFNSDNKSNFKHIN